MSKGFSLARSRGQAAGALRPPASAGGPADAAPLPRPAGINPGISPRTNARISLGRIPELDAIRGLAALVVVLFHCWKSLPWAVYSPFHGAAAAVADDGLARYEWLFKYTPLRLLTAGTACVGVFFVLSGLVLALPLIQGKGESYPAFLAKRFFRLYPPFAAAILLAAALCLIAVPGPVDGLSEWFNHSWDEPLSWSLLGGHLLMLGTDAYMHLDNAMWSLVHEMRISLIFPLLALSMLRHRRWTFAAAAALLLGLSLPACFLWMRQQLDAPGPWWPLATLLDSARYLLYFVTGIWLAMWLDTLVERFGRIGVAPRAVLWCVAAGLLLSRFGPIGDGVWAAGAALLIVLSLSSEAARRVLRGAALQWLGRISYSLYLVHLPLLFLLMRALPDSAARLPGLVAVPLAALAVAQVFYKLVELPSHKLGRLLLQRRRVAEVVPAPAAVVAEPGLVEL